MKRNTPTCLIELAVVTVLILAMMAAAAYLFSSGSPW